MKKRAIEIETLTDVQISVGTGVEKRENQYVFTYEKECLFINLHGEFQTEEVDVYAFISKQNAKNMIEALQSLLSE